jgi:hypothetical protein
VISEAIALTANRLLDPLRPDVEPALRANHATILQALGDSIRLFGAHGERVVV